MRSIYSLSLVASAVSGKENPIRKVVDMLQQMQQEVNAEVEERTKLHDKYVCATESTLKKLELDITTASGIAKSSGAAAEGFAANKVRLAAEIEDAQKRRADATTKLEAETAKRNDEAAEHAGEAHDSSTDIEALKKAIVALEKGMGRGSEEGFLQTNAGVRNLLEKLADSAKVQAHLDLVGNEVLQSFLQNPSASYSSQSSEIVGILKQMEEDMTGDLADANSSEEQSAAAFADMSASLNEIVASAGTEIETKSLQKGETAVKEVEAAARAKSAGEEAAAKKNMSAKLSAELEATTAEYHENQKNASAEIEAIGQAIGVLNNDDALDLFNKTDTRPAESFAQLSLLQMNKKAKKSVPSAKEELAKIQKNATSPAVAMLAFNAKQALSAKKVDFSQILTMIEDMVKLLKQQQVDDRAAVDSCNRDLNTADKDRINLDHALEQSAAALEEHHAVIEEQDAIAAAAQADIEASEKTATQAGEQRKAENAEFVESTSLNSQAAELLLKAKDKLNAFYNPDLVRKGNRQETSEEAAARASSTFLELAEPTRDSHDSSNSVLALLDNIVNDIKTDSQEAEHLEKTAQRDYEELTQELTDAIAQSNSDIAAAIATRAEAEGSQAEEGDNKSRLDEQDQALAQYTAERKGECDFVINNFDTRKTARESEIEGLKSAQAALQGADI